MSIVKYRSEIDGLRALAVLSVILFHINKRALPGGFAGVDVFFVISGFLITSIIYKEYYAGVFKLSKFWLRRIRRIFPALIVMVLIVLFFGKITLYGPDINDLGKHGIASLLSFANFSHWLVAGNYWGGAAENSPLLHTWSLSLEEQFYLCFPWMILLSFKYCDKWAFEIFFSFTLLSYFLFLYEVKFHPAAAFYLLPTRAWELGFGCLSSLYINKNKKSFRFHLMPGFIGLILILCSFRFLGEDNGVTFLIAIPVLGTLLIILFAGDSNSLVNKFLSLSPIVYIGKISYSLYLWHWPILVLSKQYTIKSHIEFSPYIIFFIIFIISVLSYHIIELPFRNKEKIIYYVAPFLVLGVIFGFYLKITDFSQDISMYNKTVWYGSLYNVNPNCDWPESVKKRMNGIVVPNRNSIEKNIYSSGGIFRKYGGPKPEVMVLGDSHALMWSPVIDDVAKYLRLFAQFSGMRG